MSKKVIPFIKPVQQKFAGVPALSSQGPKKSNDGKIIDHGTLGNLEYEIYERGVIHIFESSSSPLFKKDIYVFEDEIRGIDFDLLPEGEDHIIKGSGDNDHIVFTKENGDIKISLKHREFEALALLKSILTKGHNILKGGK
jgi:hypothetical protein